jgi:hypothetical protein
MRAIDMRRACDQSQAVDMPMIKMSFPVRAKLGTALAGTAGRKFHSRFLIGFVTAMPLSYVVARKIGASPTR